MCSHCQHHYRIQWFDPGSNRQRLNGGGAADGFTVYTSRMILP